jgi:hypothetical protein
MESWVEDVLSYLGQALTILALWLDRVTGPIPWPLVVAFLFLPILAAFRTALWVMRGTSWPVACKYYHTQQHRADKACRTPVVGEWYYCRHHRKPKIMSDGHRCDPSVQRWQARTRGGVLKERSDVRGVGFVQLLSNRETLLFYKGLARRPADVLPGLFPRELSRRWTRELDRLRRIQFRDIFERSKVVPQGVSVRMPQVVQATRFALAAYAVGLLAVGVSVFYEGTSQIMQQYDATASFILAWNAFRFGILRSEDVESPWLRDTVFDSTKAFCVLIVLAIVGHVLNSAQAAVQPQ